MNFQDEMAWSGVRVIRDDYRQWRGCQRKVRYATKRKAERAMRRFKDGDPMMVYECVHCYGWHVGHRSR